MLVALAAFHRARGTLSIAVTATSAAVVLLVAARFARFARRSRSLHSDPSGGQGKAEVCVRLAAQVAALATAAREPPLLPDAENDAEQPLNGGTALPAARTVQFDQRVACILVRDLTELPLERKTEFWWQQVDFEEFLRVRVTIGKAYRDAAKKIGVDVMQVSSIGSHGDEGYRAMIQASPELAQESRRGLGLGRKRQRAKNRDAYIAAVLDEQRRQQEAFEEEADDEAPRGPFALNAEALARIAERVSAKDRDYAHHLAHLYYEQDREAEANTEPCGAPAAAAQETDATVRVRKPSRGSLWMSESLPLPADNHWQAESSADEAEPLVRENSLRLKDDTDIDSVAGIIVGGRKVPASSPSLSTKGFGLSRDKLKEVGLSATGHALSKKKAQLHGGAGSGHVSDDSDVTAGESEDDSPTRSANHYSASADTLFSQKTDARTYGTRNGYRNWRAWAKASANQARK